MHEKVKIGKPLKSTTVSKFWGETHLRDEIFAETYSARVLFRGWLFLTILIIFYRKIYFLIYLYIEARLKISDDANCFQHNLLTFLSLCFLFIFLFIYIFFLAILLLSFLFKGVFFFFHIEPTSWTPFQGVFIVILFFNSFTKRMNVK